LTPAAARLKEIEDAAKTETQKLAEERDALKTKATRAEALEAEVQALFDDATKGLSDVQKAAIVATRLRPGCGTFGVDGRRDARRAGIGKSPGGQLPGRGGANVMKSADFFALPMGGPFEAAEKRRKAGELTVVP